MASETMTEPIKAIRKLRGRSLDELRERGRQAVAAYRDRLSLRQELPDDQKFFKQMDRSLLKGAAADRTSVRSAFYENAEQCFFAHLNGGRAKGLFRQSGKTMRHFCFLRPTISLMDDMTCSVIAIY